VVSVHRGLDLFAGRNVLTAPQERRWMAWAYRQPDLEDLFADLEPRLDEQRDVVLLLPESVGSTWWWWAMTEYYLPERRVVAARRYGLLLDLPSLQSIGALHPGTRFSRWLDRGMDERALLGRAQRWGERAPESPLGRLLARRVRTWCTETWGEAGCRRVELVSMLGGGSFRVWRMPYD
jgi:hypothetical protein